MTTTINHQTEAHQAEAHGHHLGCFETLAEEILEDLAGQGYTYQTGAFNEEIAGLTVLERIILRLDDSCECGTEEE
jgi:hypothetical protein